MPAILAWIGAVTGLAALGVAAYEIWADVETERIILEEIRVIHGQQAAVSPMRQEAWGTLLSGRPVDARLLGIGGM